jgi:hypothetical protein
VAKKNADKPKPDRTRPVIVPREVSGKLFAVVFIATARPAFPAKPVMQLQAMRMARCINDVAVPVPSS